MRDIMVRGACLAVVAAVLSLACVLCVPDCGNAQLARLALSWRSPRDEAFVCWPQDIEVAIASFPLPVVALPATLRPQYEQRRSSHLLGPELATLVAGCQAGLNGNAEAAPSAVDAAPATIAEVALLLAHDIAPQVTEFSGVGGNATSRVAQIAAVVEAAIVAKAAALGAVWPRANPSPRWLAPGVCPPPFAPYLVDAASEVEQLAGEREAQAHAPSVLRGPNDVAAAELMALATTVSVAFVMRHAHHIPLAVDGVEHTIRLGREDNVVSHAAQWCAATHLRPDDCGALTASLAQRQEILQSTASAMCRARLRAAPSSSIHWRFAPLTVPPGGVDDEETDTAEEAVERLAGAAANCMASDVWASSECDAVANAAMFVSPTPPATILATVSTRRVAAARLAADHCASNVAACDVPAVTSQLLHAAHTAAVGLAAVRGLLTTEQPAGGQTIDEATARVITAWEAAVALSSALFRDVHGAEVEALPVLLADGVHAMCDVVARCPTAHLARHQRVPLSDGLRDRARAVVAAIQRLRQQHQHKSSLWQPCCWSCSSRDARLSSLVTAARAYMQQAALSAAMSSPAQVVVPAWLRFADIAGTMAFREGYRLSQQLSASRYRWPGGGGSAFPPELSRVAAAAEEWLLLALRHHPGLWQARSELATVMLWHPDRADEAIHRYEEVVAWAEGVFGSQAPLPSGPTADLGGWIGADLVGLDGTVGCGCLIHMCVGWLSDVTACCCALQTWLPRTQPWQWRRRRRCSCVPPCTTCASSTASVRPFCTTRWRGDPVVSSSSTRTTTLG